MAKEPVNWDEVFEEQAEANRKAWDSVDHEKVRAKFEQERKRAIELGWMDEDGNSLLPDNEEDEEDEEEQE